MAMARGAATVLRSNNAGVLRGLRSGLRRISVTTSAVGSRGPVCISCQIPAWISVVAGGITPFHPVTMAIDAGAGCRLAGYAGGITGEGCQCCSRSPADQCGGRGLAEVKSDRVIAQRLHMIGSIRIKWRGGHPVA